MSFFLKKEVQSTKILADEVQSWKLKVQSTKIFVD